MVKKQGRPTIRDVAREAGVGTTTVSRVINGGNLVAPTIRKRVEAVIRELHFQPSHAARSLKQDRSRSIGLIVPRLTDPFFSSIASVAQSVCRANQHILMISTSLDQEEQAVEEIKGFEQQRVDGLILVPPMTQSAEFLSYCRQASERMVAVDLPVRGVSIPSVQTDNVAAMAKAANHLVEHKRKRILFLASDPELHTMKERRKGYSDAMEAAKLPVLVRENIHTVEDAVNAIRSAYSADGSIDGLLTANGQLGVLAFQALEKLGIDVPSQVAFITFDDFALADLLRPSLTCVAQPVHEMGKVATELLFSLMETPGQKTRHIRLPSTLVLRNSCGCIAKQ
jgi:LacI family transcriptional regulator